MHLPKIAILLYSRPGDIVLDPFMGTGTSALAAKINGRKYIGYDIDPKYVELANKRVNYKTVFDFGK
jgi:site-specific DNA-methyltransferase (adenine-specific)